MFAYETPRIASIRDRKLGLLGMLLQLVVFSYIVVYQIAYKGEHFKVEKVDGVYRLQWQQPTQDSCNPMDIDCMSNLPDIRKLNYCSQSAEHGIVESAKRTCIYKDAWELPIQLPAGVLLPTHIQTYKQARACSAEAPECLRKYLFEQGSGKYRRLHEGIGEAKAATNVFVTDVEDFSMLIDHSFSTRSNTMSFDDYQMQGYWMDCSKGGNTCEKKPIKCVHERCKHLGFALAQEVP